MSSGCAAMAPAEFGAVVHGQIGAIAVRRHKVRGVAEQDHPQHAIPLMPGGQGMNGAPH
jgi:hypothetical protein